MIDVDINRYNKDMVQIPLACGYVLRTGPLGTQLSQVAMLMNDHAGELPQCRLTFMVLKTIDCCAR